MPLVTMQSNTDRLSVDHIPGGKRTVMLTIADASVQLTVDEAVRLRADLDKAIEESKAATAVSS